MQTRRLASIGLALAASGSVFAGIATASPSSRSPQETQLDQACGATADSIDAVLGQASATQAKTIQSRLVVTTPGKLTGRIAFNRYGKTITVASDASSTRQGFGCSQGRAGRHGLGPGTSRVVSTISETFAKPGTYRVTFKLNQVGLGMLAQLAAAQRTYQKQHPNGHQPPMFAFGVALSYETSG